MPSVATASSSFSLLTLERQNPGLAERFLWGSNPMLPGGSETWLNLGCGARSFDGFVNIDIQPQDLRTVKWNLLDPWPVGLAGKSDGLFSEDCLEHFFHAEQTYILCNVNWTMKPGGVARVLMPSLPKVLEAAANPDGPEEYLRRAFCIETAADLINHALRFTGHRWLHSSESMAHMARSCGFVSTVTTSAESGVPKLRNLNLRDDKFTLATDLKKTRNLRRLLVQPAVSEGVQMVEIITGDAALYVATAVRPTIEYRLPEALFSADIGCMNVRSANLSSTDWNLKYLAFDDGGQLQWGFDETLKSQACMNIITQDQIRSALGGHREFSKLRFTPTYQPGEYFTLGPVEIFAAE
jgi:predicted SAM-dependent methyltransferase